MVWLKLLRSRVAPLATVNALNGENALTAPACSVPALTDVAPVYVLLPDSVSVRQLSPAPDMPAGLAWAALCQEENLRSAQLGDARTGVCNRLPHPVRRARRVDVPDAKHRQSIDDGVDAGRQ
jgi:hypothetical protein